jgi:uncharacterized membrane protein (DUF2068 family)
MSKSRPPALLAIVIYKFFTVGLLACVAIGLLVTSNKHDALLEFSDNYMMVGKREIIKSGLTNILSISTTKLKFAGIVALIYGIVNGIEAVGLWYEKAWATIMVVGIVGITIPVEIFEIIHKASLIKVGVFAINVAMFVYLLRHAIEQHSHRKKIENNPQYQESINLTDRE